MTTYRVTLADGQTFVFSGNMSEASTPIAVNFFDAGCEHDWQPTPYQTASAGHSEMQAAKLLIEHYFTGQTIAVKSVEIDLSDEDTRRRAVEYAKGRIMQATDWQEVQNDLANHSEFGPWLEAGGNEGSESQSIIRDAEDMLGDKIPAAYAN